MNTAFRYKLEKGSKKHVCPSCKKKRFVKYIDTQTSEYLPDNYGRCDRESNCGYYLNPYENSYAKMIIDQEEGNAVNWKLKAPTHKPQPKKETVFIPVSELQKTLKDYDKNIFIQNLLTKVEFPFDAKDVETLISLYRLGTNAKNGAVCFPFIDASQNIRAVQEKIFNATNHTAKSKKYHTSWLHSRLQYSYKNKPLPDWLECYLNNDTKVSCLFGEHLLTKYPHNPVALVEAPKTAIYGALYFGFPELPTNLIWLAVFNLSSLTYEKCKILKGRDVYLFPDASKDGSAFNNWSNKAEEIKSKLNGTYFKVSDLLEKYATDVDKEQGNDLADYLINIDWRKFREFTNNDLDVKQNESNLDTIKDNKTINLNEAEVSTGFHDIFETENVPKEEAKWDEDIKILEFFFKSITLKENKIKINQHSTILNVSTFIDSHLAIVKAQSGNTTFLPYLERLQNLKSILCK